MGIVMQYAIFKITTKDLMGGHKELGIAPVNETGNTSKLAVFPTEEDAKNELKKLIFDYSSTKYLILPIYGDSKSIEATEVRL